MRILPSARKAIELMLIESEAGSVPSIALGYSYDSDWNKIPSIDITCISAELVDSMKADYLANGEGLLQEYDGFTFAMVIADEDNILSDRLLAYENSEFTLKLN